MNEAHDPNRTVDVPGAPADLLDAGLAAGFGRVEPPRSSLGAMRPLLLKEAEGESDHIVKPHSDAMPSPGQTGDRYQLFGEIARGGMGAVLRGRDVDLGRDLAVKVLLEKHADRPAVARRFLEEAQIGGQLQHPGVVPVYDIGRFGDRPFFTMKLVKGQTLASLLAPRMWGAPETSGRLETDRPRFLAIALQVTQALAYAHAKGVIHRDLKPANIMVGAFGEVQVMDWGLAKVLAEGGVADEERASRQHQPEEGTVIRTARSSGKAGSVGTDTEAGSLLGTPAYMPPEQANHLDRRADVFGLGAILCEILTGKPPYVGRSTEEVRRKAANGDLADAQARLDACGADAELIALTKACLAPEASDRPKDAQAVADGLTAYLDGVQERLRQAELAEAAAAKAQEERSGVAPDAGLGGDGADGCAGRCCGHEHLPDRSRAGARARRRCGRLCPSGSGGGATPRRWRGCSTRPRRRCRPAMRPKHRCCCRHAAKRADEGGADALRERRAWLQEDLGVLTALDEVDRLRWTPVDNRFPDSADGASEPVPRCGWCGSAGDQSRPAPAEQAAARVAAATVRDLAGRAALDRWLRQEQVPWVRRVLRRGRPGRVSATRCGRPCWPQG